MLFFWGPMKQIIKNIILEAAKTAHAKGDLASPEIPEPNIEEPKSDAHGDFSTNIAMVMASAQKLAPRKIAEAVIAHVNDPDGIIARTDIAGPGFINFFLGNEAWHVVIDDILEQGDVYGRSDTGKGQRIQVEFVSANPTGSWCQSP